MERDGGDASFRCTYLHQTIFCEILSDIPLSLVIYFGIKTVSDIALDETLSVLSTYVEIKPEYEDDMADDVENDERNEDVSLHLGHELGAVLGEDRHGGVPDADHTEYDERQQYVLVLNIVKDRFFS